MIRLFNYSNYLKLMLKHKPSAKAIVNGSNKYPDINGVVCFYETNGGVLLCVNVIGLPHEPGKCNHRVFGFHIHEGMSCTGNAQDPFADAKTHYNPLDCPHPQHSGDLPPLFENQGHAFMVFLTQRFTVNEVMGRTVIIHDMSDDFVTQPSGNSGNKIACGVITR